MNTGLIGGIVGCIIGITFIVLLILLSTPWRFILWIPYSIILPIGIITWNRTQQKIREEESMENTINVKN